MPLLALGLGPANGQGWLQLGELALAFALSSLIGLEREWRIFVRSDIVRGLTTAAIVWMTAAIGMACGAGLWLLAIAVVRVVYADGRGILRTVLAECTRRAFAVESIETQRLEPAAVAVTLELQSRGSVEDLTVALSELDGVTHVTSD